MTMFYLRLLQEDGLPLVYDLQITCTSISQTRIFQRQLSIFLTASDPSFGPLSVQDMLVLNMCVVGSSSTVSVSAGGSPLPCHSPRMGLQLPQLALRHLTSYSQRLFQIVLLCL